MVKLEEIGFMLYYLNGYFVKRRQLGLPELLNQQGIFLLIRAGCLAAWLGMIKNVLDLAELLLLHF